jgi:hypothetical protein
MKGVVALDTTKKPFEKRKATRRFTKARIQISIMFNLKLFA